MSSGRYFEIIVILCCGFCGVFSSFAGGGEVEYIEMQPLLGPAEVSWAVVYEPKISENPDFWIEDMEKDLDEMDQVKGKHPILKGMSSYVDYSAISRSPCVLEIPFGQDENGKVMFVKNNSTKKTPEISCFDMFKQCPFIGCWMKICFNPFLKNGKHGFNNRNKGNSSIRESMRGD